jgi:hypothetical protein
MADPQVRRNQDILKTLNVIEDHPKLAKALEEAHWDEGLREEHNRALALGLEGHELHKKPDRTDEQLAQMGLMEAMERNIAQREANLEPEMNPLWEKVFDIFKTKMTANQSAAAEKVKGYMKLADTKALRLNEFDEALDTDILNLPGEKANVLRTFHGDYLGPTSTTMPGDHGFGMHLGNLLKGLDGEQQANALAWLSAKSGWLVGDIEASAVESVGEKSPTATALNVIFTDILKTENNAIVSRAILEEDYQGLMADAQRQGVGLPPEFQKILGAMLGGDKDELAISLGLKAGTKEIPQSEAAAAFFKANEELFAGEAERDWWESASEHKERIFESDAFAEFKRTSRFTGTDEEVYERAMDQWDHEMGDAENMNQVITAYRINELGQPAGSLRELIKAKLMKFAPGMGRVRYNELKAQQEGLSEEEALRDTDAEQPEEIAETNVVVGENPEPSVPSSQIVATEEELVPKEGAPGVQTATDGWADYSLHPDGRITFTVPDGDHPKSGEELTYTEETHPKGYGLIMDHPDVKGFQEAATPEVEVEGEPLAEAPEVEAEVPEVEAEAPVEAPAPEEEPPVASGLGVPVSEAEPSSEPYSEEDTQPKKEVEREKVRAKEDKGKRQGSDPWGKPPTEPSKDSKGAEPQQGGWDTKDQNQALQQSMATNFEAQKGGFSNISAGAAAASNPNLGQAGNATQPDIKRVKNATENIQAVLESAKKKTHPLQQPEETAIA